MRDDEKNIKEIIKLADNINDAVIEFGDDIEDFLSSPIFKAGCTMYLMQIGEYSRRLSDDFIKSHPEVDWDGLRGLRNIIAHKYEEVDYNRLWTMITVEVPALSKICRTYIANNDN